MGSGSCGFASPGPPAACTVGLAGAPIISFLYFLLLQHTYHTPRIPLFSFPLGISGCPVPVLHRITKLLFFRVYRYQSSFVCVSQPRSRRLQALARRSSRRAAPRSVCDLFDVSFRLVRRLSRVPFVPWKAFRVESICVPVGFHCPYISFLSMLCKLESASGRTEEGSGLCDGLLYLKDGRL